MKAATMDAQKSSRKATRTKKKSVGFTDEEQLAMRERSEELRRETRHGTDAADSEAEVLAKIAAMAPADRVIAERLHAIIKANAPPLSPKLWYGMPAYAQDGKVVCFFQDARKFKTRYATLGFSDRAKLDEGNMWPTGFALKELTTAEERRIVALLKKALGRN